MKNVGKVVVTLLILGIISSCMKDNNDEFQISNHEDVSAYIPLTTGQDIFKGIFFKSGEVAKLIAAEDYEKTVTALNELTAEKLAELNDIENQIISSMSSNDPTFFDAFYFEMTSGDHYRIQKAFDRSIFEFNAALLSIPSISGVADKLAENKFDFNDYVDNDGNVDFASFEKRLAEIYGPASTDISESGKCIFWGIIIIAYYAVIAAGAVAVATAVVIVTAFAFAAAAAQEVIVAGGGGGRREINQQKMAGTSQTLKMEVFINEISEKLYVPS